jgi:hypothetical protein
MLGKLYSLYLTQNHLYTVINKRHIFTRYDYSSIGVHDSFWCMKTTAAWRHYTCSSVYGEIWNVTSYTRYDYSCIRIYEYGCHSGVIIKTTANPTILVHQFMAKFEMRDLYTAFIRVAYIHQDKSRIRLIAVSSTYIYIREFKLRVIRQTANARQRNNLRYQAIKNEWTCCFRTAMHDYSFDTRKKIWN